MYSSKFLMYASKMYMYGSKLYMYDSEAPNAWFKSTYSMASARPNALGVYHLS